MSLEGAGADYTAHLPYNGTVASGGDSLTQDLNVFYEVCDGIYRHICVCPNSDMPQSGDIAWMITATALVLLMIPGVG